MQGYPVPRISPRRRLLHALVRRQPAGALVARAGALHARLCRTRSRSCTRCPEAPPLQRSGEAIPEAKGSTSASPPPVDKPERRDRAGRRPHHHDGGPEARPDAGTPGVIENGTVVVEGNRITAVGPSASCRCRRARSASTSRARRSCPGSSTCTGTSAGKSDGILAQIELAAGGQPRVRRDDVARSVERHRDRVHATPN